MTISITYYNYEGFVPFVTVLNGKRFYIYKNRDSHDSGVADPSEFKLPVPQRFVHHLSINNLRCIYFWVGFFSQVAIREIPCRTKTIT